MTKKDPIDCIACRAGVPLITDTSRISSEAKLAIGVTPGNVIPPAPSTQPDCVCAECGHEQSTMDPCQRCRSVRVVLITVARDLFGENWRDAFDPDKADKATP